MHLHCQVCRQRPAHHHAVLRCPVVYYAAAGVVMAKLGAEVTLTDLAGNLPLLQHNCRANGAHLQHDLPLQPGFLTVISNLEHQLMLQSVHHC